MKDVKTFYVLKNKKKKYLTDAGKRSPDISKARRFKRYEALAYKACFDHIGNEDKIVKVQVTTTFKEVK